MVTTSSSETRGSTTNISSYVRMCGEKPPFGLDSPAFRGTERNVKRTQVEPGPRRNGKLYVIAAKTQLSRGVLRLSQPLNRFIATSTPSAAHPSQAPAPRA